MTTVVIVLAALLLTVGGYAYLQRKKVRELKAEAKARDAKLEALLAHKADDEIAQAKVGAIVKEIKDAKNDDEAARAYLRAIDRYNSL